MVEAETSATESVFYFLKDNGYKNVFLNPDENLLERYIYEQKETIIVKTLVSKAPIKKEKNINIPAAEKILVDLFIDMKLFAPFQGSELTGSKQFYFPNENSHGSNSGSAKAWSQLLWPSVGYSVYFAFFAPIFCMALYRSLSG